MPRLDPIYRNKPRLKAKTVQYHRKLKEIYAKPHKTAQKNSRKKKENNILKGGLFNKRICKLGPFGEFRPGSADKIFKQKKKQAADYRQLVRKYCPPKKDKPKLTQSSMQTTDKQLSSSKKLIKSSTHHVLGIQPPSTRSPITQAARTMNGVSGKVKGLSEVKKVNDCQYREAIINVFEEIDKASKGTISEENLRGIPETALYFLGDVFVKIKREHLTLNLEQFIQECGSVYFASSPKDINHFIKDIMFKDNTACNQLKNLQKCFPNNQNRFLPLSGRFQLETISENRRKLAGQSTSAHKRLQLQEINTNISGQIQESLKKNSIGVRYENDIYSIKHHKQNTFFRPQLAAFQESTYRIEYDDSDLESLNTAHHQKNFIQNNQRGAFTIKCQNSFGKNIPSNQGQGSGNIPEFLVQLSQLEKKPSKCNFTPQTYKYKRGCCPPAKHTAEELSYKEQMNERIQKLDRNIQFQKESHDDRIEKLANRLEEYIQANALALQRSHYFMDS